MLDKHEIPIPGEAEGACVIFRRSTTAGSAFYLKRRLPIDKRPNRRNPYHVVSLKTPDLEEAKVKGYKLLLEIDGKLQSGLGLQGDSFNKISRAWLSRLVEWSQLSGYSDDHHIKQSAIKRHKSVLDRYLLPFFGGIKIAEIQQTDCQRYTTWRRNFYLDGPGKLETSIEFTRNGKKYNRPTRKTAKPSYSTLIKDAATFNAIMKYAEEERGVQFSTRPTLKFKKSDGKPVSRRERFQKSEMEALLKGLEQRCIPGNGVGFNSLYYRIVLNYLVEFLYVTGIRPSEAMWLKKKHLVGKADQLRVHIAQDNPALKSLSHVRVVIPKRSLEQTIQNLFSFYEEVWTHNFPQSIPERMYEGAASFDFRDCIADEQWLFAHPNKGRIVSMRKSFGNAMDDLGLRGLKDQKRSLYSLRHTYASEMIEEGVTAKGLWTLCQNLGTSPAMLTAHYGQALHEVDAEMFLGAELVPEGEFV